MSEYIQNEKLQGLQQRILFIGLIIRYFQRFGC